MEVSNNFRTYIISVDNINFATLDVLDLNYPVAPARIKVLTLKRITPLKQNTVA